MKIVLAAVMLLFLALTNAHAMDGAVTVHCEDPRGYHLRHGPNVLTEEFLVSEISEAERFGSAPIFIIAPQYPNHILVLWGHGVPDDIVVPGDIVERLFIQESVEFAEIVARGETHITAMLARFGATEIFTLYPELGYGIFTTHSELVMDGAAHAHTYYGNCEFVE